MIRSLNDPADFRRRRREAWVRNVDYWLAEELRHVVDVGPFVLERLENLCRKSAAATPVILDMGFGSAWLLQELLRRKAIFEYIGVDALEPFVARAVSGFANPNASFILGDLEQRIELGRQVDIAVNMFNFFELCDLEMAMSNAARHLVRGGRLFMSTIDKTYLLLALSNGWGEFHENLRLYQELPGTKFEFQQIDLGAAVSDSLEYPSVLYSTQDYIDAARRCGMNLVRYEEQNFTARAVPKIYCHLEFEKVV